MSIDLSRSIGTDEPPYEVWEGEIVVSPVADIEHQELAGRLVSGLNFASTPKGSMVIPTPNVSDGRADWRTNYRNPDASVLLPARRALNRRSHLAGGPDLAVEIVSEDDASRDKLSFYAAVGVREVWVIDRDPWAVELYALEGAELVSRGVVRAGDGQTLASRVIAVDLTLEAGEEGERPVLAMSDRATGRTWRA